MTDQGEDGVKPCCVKQPRREESVIDYEENCVRQLLSKRTICDGLSDQES